MIFTESTIKISNNVSKMDSTIVLYRGDKNVEIRFTILQSPFKYSNTVATNVIESTNASYGQLVIKTPNDKPPIFSEVSATKEGTVLFTITKEMIDEIEEVGVYTFQIRLMDENKQSRVTIPPVENGIEIKEPIAIEDDNTTNVVGLAKANYAVATLSDADIPTFDDNGKYNKTNWNDGDIITNVSLNKIEDGIYTTNANVPHINSETALLNITVDQLNKAWTECQATPDDTSMYIEVPNFTIKDDTLFFIESNNKRYSLSYVSTEKVTDYNKTRINMEFYNINDVTNNIMGGAIETFYDKTYEYNENKAVVKIDRVDDNKPPIFTGGIKLFEISVNKLNSLLLGKDVDIYNSLSIQRNPNSEIGQYSTATGNFTEASGFCSHAEGSNTTASGMTSHAEGSNTTASGMTSHAEGSNTTASGTTSHAEGSSTVASNFNSHAEGGTTTASGFCSHSEGSSTVASGVNSHAEGNCTTASGESSHAEGYGSKASSQFQHVQGKYNIEDKNRKYAHIVGNGSGDNKRSNAHTLDWKGNGWYAGKLSQDGTPTEDKDLTTKKYVDDNMKTAINGVKGDLGTEELTTTAKDLRGAVNELNTQYKDIAKQTITTEERNKLTSLNNYDDTSIKNDIQVQKTRIDNLATLNTGSTTGDAELIDGRTGANGVTYKNIGDAIRTQCGNLNTLLDVKYEPISNNCIDDSKFVGKNFDSIFGHNGNKKFKLAKKLTSNRIKGYIELEDGTTPSTAFQIYLTTSVEDIQGVEDIQLSIGGTLVVSDDFDKFDTISVDCWQIYDKNIKTFFIGNYADEYDNYKTQPKSKALENVDSKISNIPPEQCTFFTKVDNLLKNVNLQKGYGINPNHGMPDKLTGIERTTTDFMELRDDCKSTYCNINGYIYYYDANKKYLQSISPQNLETPAGIVALPQSDTKIKYIRYTFVTEDDAALATYWITDQGKPYENDKLYISKDKIEDMSKTESWYKGKKICAYGDSVTEQNKWQSFVSSYFNCSFYNRGVGGTTVTQINSSTNHMSGDTRIETIPTDSDVVLVFGGHNDWSNASINMGDIKTDALSESTSFKSAFGLMLKKIQTRCPNAKIITMTPVGGRTEEASSNQDKQFYIRDLCMTDFANAVKEVSAYYGIPCIDINANSGINTLNHTTYIADLIHPNLEGGKLIANEVINGLKRFEPIVF